MGEVQSSIAKKAYEEALLEIASCTDSRNFFQEDEKRGKLSRQILEDLLAKEEEVENPKLHIILGSIASGKTSLKDKITENKEETKNFLKSMDSSSKYKYESINALDKNFLYINYDDIKKKLPEYETLKSIEPKLAASFVQSESANIAAKLFKKSIKKKLNIIYEQNLHYKEEENLAIKEKIEKAWKKGYMVEFHVVFLENAEQALDRHEKRFLKTKRHVSEEYVRQTFNRLYPNLKKIIQFLKEEKKLCTMDLYDNSKERSTWFCTLLFIPKDKFFIPNTRIAMKYKTLAKIIKFILEVWSLINGKEKNENFCVLDVSSKKEDISLYLKKNIHTLMLSDRVWVGIDGKALSTWKEKSLDLLKSLEITKD